MKFWIKKHYEFDTSKEGEIVGKKERYVLAICDESLLGRRLRGVGIEGEESTISKEFYGEELIEEEEVLKLIEDKDLIAINAMGEGITKLLLEKGYGTTDQIREIDGLKHLIVFFI